MFIQSRNYGLSSPSASIFVNFLHVGILLTVSLCDQASVVFTGSSLIILIFPLVTTQKLLPHLTDINFSVREDLTQPTEQRATTVTVVGGSKNGALQLYVQWQGMSVVKMRQADEATGNAGDSAAKCQ
jgi:hypothetical protein